MGSQGPAQLETDVKRSVHTQTRGCNRHSVAQEPGHPDQWLPAALYRGDNGIGYSGDEGQHRSGELGAGAATPFGYVRKQTGMRGLKKLLLTDVYTGCLIFFSFRCYLLAS